MFNADMSVDVRRKPKKLRTFTTVILRTSVDTPADSWLVPANKCPQILSAVSVVFVGVSAGVSVGVHSVRSVRRCPQIGERNRGHLLPYPRVPGLLDQLTLLTLV